MISYVLGIINGKLEKELSLSFNELITHSKSMQCNMFPKLKIFQTHNAFQSVMKNMICVSFFPMSKIIISSKTITAKNH